MLSVAEKCLVFLNHNCLFCVEVERIDVDNRKNFLFFFSSNCILLLAKTVNRDCQHRIEKAETICKPPFSKKTDSQINIVKVRVFIIIIIIIISVVHIMMIFILKNLNFRHVTNTIIAKFVLQI